MTKFACWIPLLVLVFCSSPSLAAELLDQPATGSCTIQPTWIGCRMCCDIDAEISSILAPACQTTAITGGALVGGPIGAGIGRLFGGPICTVMAVDSNCYERCTGKDGDPEPVECLGPLDPDRPGVCRQVCEQGQNNAGPGTCVTGFTLDLTCCVDEYEPPDELLCPPSICPGLACPPECDHETLP